MDEIESLQQSITFQREALIYQLAKPMARLAHQCQKIWPNFEQLDSLLRRQLRKIPYCKFLYVIDLSKIQLTGTIAKEQFIDSERGRDRSARPYLKGINENIDFILSPSYISLRARRPSITAIQAIRDAKGIFLGYLCADFDIRDLPLTGDVFAEPRAWRQIKGDPAIRSGVFLQSRSESVLDANIDTVIGVLEEIMTAHGVYHVMLHFSSNRAVIWHYDDPYRYHLLDVHSLIDANTCLAFPRRDYPGDAQIPRDRLRDIFEGFRLLRVMDDTLYLRTGTVNIFNGIIGLTFSCDGSHYLPFEEFLNREHAVWAAANNSSINVS